MTGEDSRLETADDCVTEGCWRDVGPGVGLELAANVPGGAERWEEVAERGALTRARCRQQRGVCTRKHAVLQHSATRSTLNSDLDICTII